uniref:hypothetical protein n=1 Tax=Pandoraea pnomenusa TaxID=93220 RepID=UPI0003C74FC8|nr:hypothetical protein [Pandoraea pnomenusa]
MSKFIKAFLGVPKGEIYPVQYQAGDECPIELEAGAAELGALEEAALEDSNGAIRDMTAAQIKDALKAKGIDFKANANKEELVVLLQAAGE